MKQCRLVSQSWNLGATPVLKERTRMKINLCAENEDKELDGIIGKLKFSPLHVSLEVEKSPDEKESKSPGPPPPDLKLFSTVENVKSVLVDYDGRQEWQKDLCYKIILTSAPTLEDLSLDCSNDFDVPSFPRDTLFPKVRELAIFYWWELKDKDVKKKLRRAQRWKSSEQVAAIW